MLIPVKTIECSDLNRSAVQYSSLSPNQLDMLLCHELIHIKREDHWVSWLRLAAVTGRIAFEVKKSEKNVKIELRLEPVE